MRPKESTAAASPSGGQAMAAQPCCPCRRKARGKAGERRVFEVGFGADLGQRPLRKLAPQEQAEALAEHQPAAAPAQFGAGAAAQIEQEHLAFAAGEAFHGQLQARGGGFVDCGETAAPVARAVPGLQSKPRAAHFQCEVFSGEGE